MKKAIYFFGVFLIAAFCIAPLINLFLVPDASTYADAFASENTRKAALNTVLVSGLVGLCCLLIGLPLSWLLTRTDLKFKSHFRSWFCLPYAIPPFVGAIGWIILANPTSGVLNQWFGLGLNIYSFAGLVWVETSFLFTFVLLNALTLLDQMDSSLDEAARLSGASGLRVFLILRFLC